MVPAPVERSELPGHRRRSQIPQHRQWWRSRSLAQRCGRCGSERSAEFGSVYHSRCPHARARDGADSSALGGRPTCTGRLGGAAAAGRRRHFFFAELLLAASAADAGARAIGADADVGFAWSGRRRWCRRRSSAASYRVIDDDRKFRSTDSGGALARSLSAAAGAARKDQRNLAAFTIRAALTRARETAPIPARSDADRPAPAGSAALRLLADVDISFSRNCCWQLRRRTLELGRPAPMLTSASPGRGGGDGAGAGRAQRATGSSTTIANSAAPTVVALSLARSALRPVRLGKISGIWQRLPFALPSCARARRRRFQRALTPTDLHRPAGRRCGCWPTSTFLFRGIVAGSFGGGRWSSGDRRRC